MLTENVKLLQKACLVNDDGKILILKRQEGDVSRPGCWDLPGGNSEWPGSDEGGFGQYKRDIVREVKEETGIDVDPTLINQSDQVYFDTFFDVDKQIFTIIVGWCFKSNTTEVKLSDEHTAYAWVKKDELDDYDFGGKKGEFVKEILLESFKKKG